MKLIIIAFVSYFFCKILREVHSYKNMRIMMGIIIVAFMSQNGNDFFFSLIGYLSPIIWIFVWLVGFISSMEQGKKQKRK